MRIVLSLAVAGVVVLAGCAAASPVETSPSPASPSSAAAFTLREAPANLGCDSIGWPDEIEPYSSLTFRIDPAAQEQVRAVSDTGRELITYWEAGFVPGSAAELAIRDPDGQVVVHDEEVVATAAGWDLHGHFVCMNPDELYVMLTQPG